MAELDAQGRPQPPSAADEAGTLVGFLEFQRATFAWKCARLDAAGLTVKVAASSMTLGGMIKHLALVENYWFSEWLADRPPIPPWNAVDWDADPDWEWHSAAEDTPDQLRALWEANVAQSRTMISEAIDRGGLGGLALHHIPEEPSPSLRWILCHMIEEYARHNGHADLIRESIDGETGE